MPSGSRYYFTLIILLLIPFVSDAQYKSKFAFFNGFKVAPMIGANLFYGDLVNNVKNKNLSSAGISGGVLSSREINTYLSARLEFLAGNMKGEKIYDTPDLEKYNAEFKNFYVDAALGLSFRPLDLISGYYKERPFNPYIFAQFGGIFSHAHRWGDYKSPGEIVDTTMSTVSPVIPLGLGVTFFLTPRISIIAEASGSFVLGDYVDGYKYWYNADGTPVNTDSNDFYYTITAGITYLISDATWKNNPKYNRKAYLKTRSAYKKSTKKKYKPKKRKTKHKKYKPPKRRRR